MAATMPGRALDVTTCAVLGTIMALIVFVGTLLLVRIAGQPSTWSRVTCCSLVVVSLAVILVWWWIDSPAEGDTLVRVSASHGVTAGDLLVFPGLALTFSLGWWVGSLHRQTSSG